MKRLILLTVLIIIITDIKSAPDLQRAKKTSNLRIVNGRNAIRNQFPYQVSVRSNSTFEHICGGTIIGQRWVATSIRYIELYNPFELKIVAGILNLSDQTEDNQQTLDVVQILIHPNTSYNSLSHDIALLRLSSYLVYGSNVQPIPLTPAGYQALGLGTITGWGYIDPQTSERPDTLQYAYANILRPNACEVAIAKIDDTLVLLFDVKLNLCSIAPGDTPIPSTCNGDIGGPIVVNGYFVGIISWSPEYCVNPIVYTSIEPVREWIFSSTNGEVSD